MLVKGEGGARGGAAPAAAAATCWHAAEGLPSCQEAGSGEGAMHQFSLALSGSAGDSGGACAASCCCQRHWEVAPGCLAPGAARGGEGAAAAVASVGCAAAAGAACEWTRCGLLCGDAAGLTMRRRAKLARGSQLSVVGSRWPGGACCRRGDASCCSLGVLRMVEGTSWLWLSNRSWRG